ncbi:hypothetical protein ACQRIT_005146 [Beauveria bassiana]
MNGRIDKETVAQSNTSSASTITTVPNTPRDVSLSPEGDDDLDGAAQCSLSAFPTTSPPPRQASTDGPDSGRRSPSIPTEVAEQGHGQAEDADESLSSHRNNREPSCCAELLRQTQPHEGAIHNDLASIDGDGIADDGDSDSSRDADSDSSSDNDSGNDGEDDDYNDDGSSSDTDGEDGGHSKKRRADQSPSVTSSADGHADGFSDDNRAVKTPRPHKRQKAAHEGADMTPVCSQNPMPRSGGPPLRSPRRAQTAGMLSPPASHSLSEPESENGSDCVPTSAGAFLQQPATAATAQTGQEQGQKSKIKG